MNKTSTTTNFAIRITVLACILISSSLLNTLQAQLTGTKNIPGDFATLAAAITALNTQGVGPGGVTLNVVAANPQSVPAGGYIIGDVGSAILVGINATSVTQQVIIQGNLNTLTTSSALAVGSLNDGVFKLIGADWITIQGFTMQENAANLINTPAASNNMTEWGVALLYVSPIDGSQNNTIKNNTISLNRTYQNSFGVYSNVRHSPADPLTLADITAPSGANSPNKIYQNNINNVNFGITMIGSAVAANMDIGNDIGGVTLATGNTITNWGGAVPLSTFISNVATSYCIFMNHEVGLNVSFNTLTSAAVNFGTATLLGIYCDYLTTSPTGTFTNNINSNTVTLTNSFVSATASQMHAIRHSNTIAVANATATVNMNSNNILNCAITGIPAPTVALTLFGVLNTANFGIVNLNSNIVQGTTSTATSGGIVGVTSQGAVVTTLNLNNNQCGTVNSNFITFSNATVAASPVNAVTSSVVITANVSISNNDVRGIVYNVATSAGAPLFIADTYAGSGTANVNNNTFTNLNLNTTGGVTFILHAGNMTATGVENMNNNSIVTGFNKAGAGGTVSFLSSNASSINGSSMTQTGNNFSNVTVTGATTIAGWSNTEGASATSAPTKTITGNTFSNIIGGSSAVTALQTNFGNATTCTGNTISNITGTGAITGISHGTSNGQGTHSYSNNTISSLTSSGVGGTVLGITGGSTTVPIMNLNNNSISGLSSTGASSTVTGIAITAGAIVNAGGNNVNSLTCSGITSPLVRGISLSAGTTVGITKNKIYNLAATGAISTTNGAVNGLLISAGTTVTASNNLIGDLRAPLANLTDAIRGINITSATTVSTINIYYNTININAQSTGTNFGTSGLFHTFNTTATTAALDLRNNIIINNSTANGTGLTVAFRRSASTNLNNYATTSNNNLFWAGGVSACTSRFIYHDGTAGFQMAPFQALVTPRETASVTEDQTFLSFVGSNSGFLHINPAIPTQTESAGATIAGITDDFDNDVRNVSTPDIGADEFSGVVDLACNGQPIAGTATAVANNICSGQSAAICLSGETPPTGTTFQWQSALALAGPYTDIICATGNCYTTGALAAGTFFYRATVTCANSGLSSFSNVVTITVNPSPSAMVTPANPTVCLGSSVTLTATGGATYLWSPSAGLNVTSGPVVIASPSSSTTYTVTVSDALGCSATAASNISVLPVPTLTVTATPATICSGGTSQLNATTTGLPYTLTNLTGQTYTTLTGGGITIINTAAQLTPGFADMTQDDGGVLVTLPFTFTYNGNTFTQMSMCTNGWVAAGATPSVITGADSRTNANFFSTVVPNNTIAAWFRDMGANFPVGTGSMRHGLIGTDVYAFQWDKAVGSGFSDGSAILVSFQVNIYGPASVAPGRIDILYGPTVGAITFATAEGIEDGIGGPNHFLNALNGSGTLTTLSTVWPGDGNGYRFTPAAPMFAWSPATFLNSTTISNPVASNVTATTTYTVTVTGPNGCTASATTTVTANPTIAIAETDNSGIANNDNIICAGFSATLTASGGISYAWSSGDITAATTVSPSSTTTYTVTVTDATGCSATATRTITVIPPLTLTTVLTQPTTCVSADGAINLTVAPAGTYTYDWADLPGTNDPEDRTGLLVGNYMVTVFNPTTNCSTSLTISLVGPGGCSVCPTIPNVSASPNPVCQNSNFTLTSTALTNMGVTYGIIFNYFAAPTGTPYTGGTVLATVLNASLTSSGTVATATASLPTAGTYFIYAILTPTPTDPTCRPSATTTLTVNAPPTAGTTVTETSGIANNDGIICAGASVTITGTGGGTYVWSTGATTTSITVSPGSTQTYTVTVSSGNSGNSCTAVATRTITVNSLPQAFTVTGGGTYCAGGNGVAVGLSGSVTGVNYQLQLNNVNTGAPVAGTGNTLNFGTFTVVGTYTVIGTSTTTGCSGPMTGSVAIATTNCTTQLFDPCTCLNNATTLTNGQFAESIKVNAPSTQTWTVTAVNGLYLMSSPPPPASPIPIPVGTVLTNLGAGMNMFILNGIHIDAIGYTVTVSNAAGTSLTIGNTCQYPNPAITSDINGTYCLYSDPITLTGNPGDANIVSQVFTVNGVPATQFNPGAGIGQYQIVYTVNGGVPKAFGPNDPGCIQSVSQFVNVIATPSTVACNDHVQISLGPDCEAEIVPSMILEGDVGCFDDYIVEMDVTLPFGDGPWIPPFLTSADIGKTYAVRVTHLGNGNSCWGTINVEDKIPPVIECRPVTILCGEALPSEPAPSITGYQNILLTGLNDLLETNSFTYNFDFSYLPSPTPALDVDVRIKIDDHTFLPDLNIELIAPSGYTKSIFTIGGCTGQDWPINCVLDDDGATITLCVDLNAGDNARLKPLQGGVSQNILFNFNGLDASGIWKVKISDNAAGDDGHVRAVGVFINVNLPPVAPTDNCGDVDLTYTDSQSGDPCEGLLVTRHWIATDQSGNTSACDQLITILPLVLDSVDCPPAYVGHCGDSTDPSHTGWPSVNGTPITDDNNVCNIFVGFWDHELNDCGNGIKLVRTWTILDWCTQTTKECVQVIKLADDQAPIISCPSNLTVGTDFWYCYANVSVPKPTVTDACGSAWTLALTATGGHIVNFGNNYVLNQLPLGTVTVTWTATDECGNSSSCSFTITVVDDVVPVANCDAHTVVALTNDGPFGITLVPAHVFDDGSYDNCGPVTFRARRMESCIDFDWTTDGACVDDIPGGIPPVNSRDKGTVSRPCVPFACCDVGAGPIMVELEVTDAAGNRNFCMVEAVVQDKISPFVQCPPDITVSCDFWFNVQEGTFVDADGNNNGNLDEDPLSPVFGNMYDAFQYNDDESVRQDIIINDPGNPHVSHPHFWGIDGWADDNCEVNLQVRVTITNDCSGDALPPGAPAGAVKLVTRRFSASDGNQGIAPGTCTQRIWVVDFDPFFITDITCGLYNNDDVVWPCDVLLTSCPDDLGDTGEPIVYDDACSLIGVAYEDQRFEFVDGACFKILRTWSVIDWCQYNSLTGEGLWHYVQVIKVHDNEGPEFLNCPTGPVTLCVADDGVSLPNNNQAFLGHDNPLSSSCSVHLNLCQAVHETCSDVVNYDVKLYLFNGDEFIYVKPLTSVSTDSSHNANLCFDTRTNSIKQIRDNGIPYNSPFCGDYHKLLWSAEDGCGNWSHCEYLIRLEDCKQPSPVCINGLSTVVMPIGGQVTIWAKDFNASSFDDCTAEEDLLYSFSGTSYTPSFTYTCDNVPAFGVELAVNIWVADGGTDDNCNGQISWSERNKDFCTTTIVITDNAHVCPDTSGSSIILAGEILTAEHQKVEKVAVNLTCPGTVFPVYVTSSDGAYTFSNIIPQTNYTVSPERNDNFMNGVSTLDLVRIQKHLLGIDPFSSPYDYIAADANNSQSVNAIDLVELRKLILGIYTELPLNKSWRFVDKAFQFNTPTHPWPFAEVIDVTNMVSNEMAEDFVAIKVGDVNNSVKANATQVLPRNDNGVVSFIANDRTVVTGELVEVAISSNDFAAIEGYQFTLQTQGLEFRGVESGIINMSDDNMGVFGSTLTASWNKTGGVSAKSSDVLFTLKFQATAPGKLSSMMALNSKETQAEAYNTQDDIKGLKLTFRGAEHGAEFALYQNEPNPFKGNTVIGYDLPAAGKVTLTLFDVTGKVLLVKDQESVKGYNTISVSSKSIPLVGVLYYRLDANEYTATKKMVIIE